MSNGKRKELIEQLQVARGGRLCIAYVTSTRSGHEIELADDVVPILHGHLEAGKAAAAVGVDLFIHSNGGSSIAPWRIVSLIREYTKSFEVLVPNRAFSAATITALGADQIVMHKMGCLGPIDPSVANVFNPPHPQQAGALAQISVEDVTAFFKLVKGETGNDENGKDTDGYLSKAFALLAEKVHPLALGNVHRHHNQSRLLATKLLRMHMQGETKEAEITKIIDHLKSNIFFHGHPISRDEARRDLGLKVVDPSPTVEKAMWELYAQYDEDLSMSRPFSPLHELEVAPPVPDPSQPSTAEIVTKLKELAANGIMLGALNEEQFVKLGAALAAQAGGAGRPDRRLKIDGMPGAYVQSVAYADVFRSDLRLERATLQTTAGPQEVVKTEVAWQRWERET